jgi:hypothetical protein
LKTAISIPDRLNESIEAFLDKSKMSRSEFFQRAAKLYLDKVAARSITANLDRVYGGDEAPADAAFRRAAISHLREVVTDDEE